MKTWIYVVLAGAYALPTAGCDLCSVYAATEAEGGSGKGVFAGVAEQFTYFNTLQVDGRDVPNDGDQYLRSSTSQLFAGYNFSRRVGLQLNVPIVSRWYGYGSARGSESGLGDVSLLANLKLYQRLTEDWTINWTALAGLKLPTGSTRLLDPDAPEFAPGIGGHDLTLGSGSCDGLLGTGFQVRWHHWFLAGAMQYAVRGEGDFDYQFANDWTWFGGPGAYLLMRDNYTLSLQAVVSGESKGQDTVKGVAMDDTAVTSVFLGPQIQYTWSSRLSAQLAVDLPAGIASTGEQLVPSLRVRAAVTLRL